MSDSVFPSLDDLLSLGGGDSELDLKSAIESLRTRAPGPEGALPLTPELLLESPSGDLFGWTQNVGMGWDPTLLGGKQYLILSTQGGLREPDGSALALGYHTGHWEIGILTRRAAQEFRRLECIPFAATVTDPCDGRTQGTTGMMDSLAYRNDAAIVMRRLIRSLPTAHGVLGIGTCDKGLPAMMMALAGCRHLPCVLVPGGVTLPPEDGEDAGRVQTIGARYAHGEITLDDAATLGCRACASPGGGCQFLGTAATSQVIGEALGLSLPHTALAPSGQIVWLDAARRSAQALVGMKGRGETLEGVLTEKALHNAMTVHAAFGGSTNLLLHVPAIAHAAGLPRPICTDWTAINRRVPRLVDVLPNGPVGHPTIRAYLAGGVPEVLIHLRELELLELDAMTVTGRTLGDSIAWWEKSEARRLFKEILARQDGVDADDVILSPKRARERGLTSTVVFPQGNLAPEGSVIKATAIEASVVDADGVYRHEGPARVFTRERDAIAAIKRRDESRIREGDVVVIICRGPMGAGMEETYQITSALRYLPFGKHVAVITDARFSGVSTGACIGHVGPEALDGGPIGKVREGDWVRIRIDRRELEGCIDLIGEGEERFDAEEGARRLAARPQRTDLREDDQLPEDTRLWALLQAASGGTWGGCVYDADAIAERLRRPHK